jgi:hypothetical protein
MLAWEKTHLLYYNLILSKAKFVRQVFEKIEKLKGKKSAPRGNNGAGKSKN